MHQTNTMLVTTSNGLRMIQALLIAGNVGDIMAVSNGFGQHESLVPPADIKQFQKWYVSYRLLVMMMAGFCTAYKLDNMIGQILTGSWHSYAFSSSAHLSCSSSSASYLSISTGRRTLSSPLLPSMSQSLSLGLSATALAVYHSGRGTRKSPMPNASHLVI